jgi:hypothetical protein
MPSVVCFCFLKGAWCSCLATYFRTQYSKHVVMGGGGMHHIMQQLVSLNINFYCAVCNKVHCVKLTGEKKHRSLN